MITRVSPTSMFQRRLFRMKTGSLSTRRKPRHLRLLALSHPNKERNNRIKLKVLSTSRRISKAKNHLKRSRSIAVEVALRKMQVQPKHPSQAKTQQLRTKIRFRVF